MKKFFTFMICLALTLTLASCKDRQTVGSQNSDDITQTPQSTNETLPSADESEFKDISSIIGKTEQGKKLVLSSIYGQSRTIYVCTFGDDGQIIETLRYYQYTDPVLYQRKLEYQFEKNDNITQTCDFILKDADNLVIGIREKDPTMGIAKSTYDETLNYYTSGQAERVYKVVS